VQLRQDGIRAVFRRRGTLLLVLERRGATDARARQNFYAEIALRSITFRGNSECLAVEINFPEESLFPVRCQIILSGLPAPYVGGLLTTNTPTSKAAFGGDTHPPGYTQASIAAIRLWRSSNEPRSTESPK